MVRLIPTIEPLATNVQVVITGEPLKVYAPRLVYEVKVRNANPFSNAYRGRVMLRPPHYDRLTADEKAGKVPITINGNHVFGKSYYKPTK